MRQIVLDTETTGLEFKAGHRIIEIGAIELIERKVTGRRFQQYLNPERDIQDGAISIHGIDAAMLADKPRFSEIIDDLLEFISGAELLIHNAPFDVGFLDQEFKLAGRSELTIESICTVTDTLRLARNKHPGTRLNLDALCKRYDVDNSQRDLHGALLDAEILVDVYLRMTGGQRVLGLGEDLDSVGGQIIEHRWIQGRSVPNAPTLSAEETAAHQAILTRLEEKTEGRCLWLELEKEEA